MKILTLLMTVALPLLSLAQTPTDTVTVFTIGDSTMANKPLDKENQERGWGQMLPMFLQGAIKVDNHAVNGRSSKSFITEGRWDKVLSLLRPGDYVIIQFGHNDEKKKNADRYTVPGGTFDDNLRRFVNEARAKGATPILMNAIARRNFPADKPLEETDDKHKTWTKDLENYPAEGAILVDTHGAYIESPRNVAKELDVPFIDMNRYTHDLIQGLGTEQSKALFMWIKPNTYEFCPNGKIDNTHLNVLGGIVVARLAVNGLASEVPALRPYILPTVYNLNN